MNRIMKGSLNTIKNNKFTEGKDKVKKKNFN